MKPQHIIAVFVLLFTYSFSLLAQPDKAAIASYLSQKNFSIDTNAGAVVLYEKGTVTIEKKKNVYHQNYHVHRVIKLLKTTGFALGTVKEIYPNSIDKPVAIQNLVGTTYSLENGKIKEEKLNREKQENKRQGKNYSEFTFTMPGIHTDVVLDYEYDLEGGTTEILPLWEFKNRTPKLSSEYEIIAPKEMEFSEVGGQQLKAKKLNSSKDAANEYTVLFTYTITEGNTQHTIWGRHNIKTLKQEPFVNNLDFYREVLTVASGKEYTGNEIKSQWHDLTSELWNNEYFGKLLTDNNPRIKAFADSITRNEVTPFAKAKTIFNYVRMAFDYNNNEGILSRRSIDQIFNNRIASEAEINLVMVAMMRMVKLNASPVILSKLNTPPASPYLPVAKQFNYTIGMVTIDNKNYFLDGSNFFNAFGALPIFCYNGYARVINEKGSDIWLTTNDHKDQSVQLIRIDNITDSSYTAEITDRKGSIEASYLRNIIGGQDTTIFEKYVRKRSQTFAGSLNIISGDAENLFDPEKDLILKYKIMIKRPAKSELTINANLLKFFTANPFNATERLLPVEFPTKYDYSYTLKIEVPANMEAKFTTQPNMGDVAIKGLETTHDMAFDKENHLVTVTTTLSISRNTFAPEEYSSLKYFFDQMVGQENAVITLKNKAK